MNCIDAIEGMAKALLEKFLDVSMEYRMDASEYIRNVKTVIDTVILFVKNNPEVSETPELIEDVLYDWAKANWLARLEKTVDTDEETRAARDLEYQAYCYDYLFAHGNYPR
jgi:glycine cleavage system H lipoate-binding protein